MLFKLSYTISRLEIHSLERMNFELLSNSESIRFLVRSPDDDERSKNYNAFLDIFSEIKPNSIINITPPHSVLDLKKIDVDEIVALLKSKIQEPLGHELLREAKELQHSSPRSAVLIAVSAIEVAVKSVIVSKVSDSAWFVNNMQSPPVVDILTQNFPLLFSDVNKFYEPTKKRGLIKVIYDAVTIRNEMVHRGALPPKRKKVAEIIAAVQALLWICDYFSGNIWAEKYIG